MKFIKKAILKISLEALDYISLRIKNKLEELDGENKKEPAKNN